MNPRRRTAVLVDQFPLLLDALADVLGRAEIDVVGRATGWARALELVARHQPDFMVGEIYGVDAELAGEAFLALARERCPTLRAIVLSSAADPRKVDAALAAGAAVYVLKTATADDFELAVRRVLRQSIHLANGHPRGASLRRTVGDPQSGLTRRELEVLRLVAEGHSNAQLARMLWVTEQTVKFHLSNIYRKLDVANRTEAGRWAQVHNLLSEAGARTSA
jgi:DNA-binding NarL/FixJ family response regulator